MSKLSTLRSQLASLRQTRSMVRWATGLAAVLVTVLWILAAVFLLDVLFQLDQLQRAVLLLVGAGVGAWAIYRYAVPMFTVTETDLDMALMVERQQQIDSDLVAALQFESKEAGQWGSVQLETAVIDYVASMGKELNVFEGFSAKQLVTRGATLLGTLLVVALVAVGYSGHLEVFLGRLALGNQHYPSRTKLEHLVVNREPVLNAAEHGTQPTDINAAQGKPVTFLVWSWGETPLEGNVRLRSVSTGQDRPVPLARIELSDLQAAHQAVADTLAGKDPPAADQRETVGRICAAVTTYDSLAVAQALGRAEENPTLLTQVRDDLDKVRNQCLAEPTAAGAIKSQPLALFAGKLPRLVDPVRYSIYLGDAWTDPAELHLIPLPVVQPEIVDVPPVYARGVETADQSAPSSLQRGVLEGSQVKIALHCGNKELREAKITVLGASTREQYALQATDDKKQHWELDPTGTPFAEVREPIRFEIQVTDTDDLHLETPLRGYIRIKSDRRPKISGDLVHRVVIPTAEPVITYNLNDDYGVAQVLLHAEISRATGATEEVTMKLHDGPQPITADRLPLSDSYALNLSSLKVDKGDEIRLVLEAIDYRGDRPGESYRSDPLLLEISDASGVLAAISEADERTEARLNDIIRRQLGIGASK